MASETIRTFFKRFFFKIQKNMTFYVFLSWCTRFLEHWVKINRKLSCCCDSRSYCMQHNNNDDYSDDDDDIMWHRFHASGTCPNHRYVTAERRWNHRRRRTLGMPPFYVARRSRSVSVTATACPVCRQHWPLTYARNTNIPVALTDVSRKLIHVVIFEST